MIFQMRLAHIPTTDDAIGCMEHHRLYEDAIKELGEWLDIPENKAELIRIYISVSYYSDSNIVCILKIALLHKHRAQTTHSKQDSNMLSTEDNNIT